MFLFPPHIPDSVVRCETQASIVTDNQLTAWNTADYLQGTCEIILLPSALRIRKGVALFEGCQPPPACHSEKGRIKRETSMGHPWNDIDRWKLMYFVTNFSQCHILYHKSQIDQPGSQQVLKDRNGPPQNIVSTAKLGYNVITRDWIFCFFINEGRYNRSIILWLTVTNKFVPQEIWPYRRGVVETRVVITGSTVLFCPLLPDTR